MTKLKFSNLALAAPMLAVFSCAAPKAIVVQEETKPVDPVIAQKAVPEVTAEPVLPTLPDDKLRIGDMETLPSDADFRSANPTLPPHGNQGAVIARPPTEPPPRPKAND